MLDKIRRYFSSPEPVTVAPTEAIEAFTDRHGDDLAAARESAEQHRAALKAALEELEPALDDLAAYSDPEDRAMMEDVLANVARDRRRQLEGFKLPQQPREAAEAVEAFIEEFGSLTQKEAAIVERAGETADAPFDALQAVRDRHEQLQSFLDGDYAVLAAHGDLEDAVDSLEELRAERDRARSAVEEVDTAAVRADIKEQQQRLEEHRERDAWTEQQEAADRVERLQEQRDAVTGEVRTAASKMERGLKKLLYAAENGDVELEEAHIDMLNRVRSGDLLDALWSPAGADRVDNAVAAATEALPQDMLDDRQREKFLDGAETLRSLDDHRQRLQELQDDIAAAEEAMEEFELKETEEMLAQDLEELRDRLRERREERERLQDELSRIDDAIAEQERRIEDLLEDWLLGDVTVTGQSRDTVPST